MRGSLWFVPTGAESWHFLWFGLILFVAQFWDSPAPKLGPGFVDINSGLFPQSRFTLGLGWALISLVKPPWVWAGAQGGGWGSL